MESDILQTLRNRKENTMCTFLKVQTWEVHLDR